MSLAVLRRSVVRAVPRTAPVSRVSRLPAARSFTSGPAPPSAGGTSWIQLALAAGLGAAGGATALTFFGGSTSDLKKETETAAKGAARSAKVAANFVPTKQDYQKVYDRIADILEAGDYDGACIGGSSWAREADCDYAFRWLIRPHTCAFGVAFVWDVRQGDQDGWQVRSLLVLLAAC